MEIAVGDAFTKCKLTACPFSGSEPSWGFPAESRESGEHTRGPASTAHPVLAPRHSAPALEVPPLPLHASPRRLLPTRFFGTSASRGAALGLVRLWVSGPHLALGRREREAASGVLHALPRPPLWPPIGGGSVWLPCAFHVRPQTHQVLPVTSAAPPRHPAPRVRSPAFLLHLRLLSGFLQNLVFGLGSFPLLFAVVKPDVCGRTRVPVSPALLELRVQVLVEAGGWTRLGRPHPRCLRRGLRPSSLSACSWVRR